MPPRILNIAKLIIEWLCLSVLLAFNSPISYSQSSLILPAAKLQLNAGVIGAIWNEDESLILTWSLDNSARVWNTKGELLHTCVHDAYITDATWIGNTNKVMTRTIFGITWLWDSQCNNIKTFRNDSPRLSPWNGDKSRILVWPEEDSGAIYGTDGKLIAKLLGNTPLLEAAWTLDGSHIIGWFQDSSPQNRDGLTKVWNSDGSLVETLPRNSLALATRWSPNQAYLLSWLNDEIQIWSVKGQLVGTLVHGDVVLDAIWNRNSTLILSWSEDGTAYIWDVNGKSLAVMQSNSAVVKATWDSDERHIITWTQLSSEVKLWDNDGHLFATLNHNQVIGRDGSETVFPHGYVVSSAAWIERGEILTTGRDFDLCEKDCIFAAHLWNDKGELLATMNHENLVYGVLPDPHETRILTWSKDMTARIWDFKGVLLKTLMHDGRVTGAAWSSNGTQVMTWSDEDNSVRLWDIGVSN